MGVNLSAIVNGHLYENRNIKFPVKADEKKNAHV